MSARFQFLLAALLVAACSVGVSSADEKIKLYDDKYDNVNVDEILANPRLRGQYYNCMMTGQCLTPDAKFMKDKFPEALVTKCKYCTEKQKKVFEKVVVWYTENDPDAWSTLLEKVIGDYKKTSGSRS